VDLILFGFGFDSDIPDWIVRSPEICCYLLEICVVLLVLLVTRYDFGLERIWRTFIRQMSRV
jgi:hypothetical protein